MLHKVLLVDDEERMLDLVELFLIPHGIQCIKETSGKKAIEQLKKEKIHLVLLDIMMPDIDGWELCSSIRQFSNVPIIMLTARTDKTDLVKGLNNGADDYITKPFDDRELVARVNAILRRSSEENITKNITYKDFTLDIDRYCLQYAEQKVQLTLKEFFIIKALVSRPNKTYTREELLNIAWEFETETDIRTVDSHIRNLREKLKKSGFPINDFLKTAWGIGYKWD